jgi:Alpha-L-arabinofuranosidase B, catalytic
MGNPRSVFLILTLTSGIAAVAQTAAFGRDAGNGRPDGPCDVYQEAHTPCVAAHSTTRALSRSYNGPLYQVKRERDGKTLDVGIVPPSTPGGGGYADAGAQDAFCAETVCVIDAIYDQSGKGNDLFQAGPGTFKGPEKGGFDTQPIADMAPVTIGGHKVYGVFNNPSAEYSLSSFDARQRLVVSYLYQLPVGKGQRFLPNLNPVVNQVIGGWGVEGITTFQEGFPLTMSVTPNILATYAFQGTERPNVVPSCGKSYSGSVTKKLGRPGSSNTYFNTGCFTIPANFTFGNEPRTDSTVRTPGTANWDMSLFKNFPIHENVSFDFRAEAFNLFNRVQFGSPNTQLGNGQFGWITAQFNNPRLLQVSGRLNF